MSLQEDPSFDDTAPFRYVATPQDIDQLCELMSTAHQRGRVVLVRGAGSKFGWIDLPPTVDVLIDMSAFTTFRYDDESKQVTLGAAVHVATVADELGAMGRRVALDPPSATATVGGVLVTGESGPLSHLFGPPAAHLVDATVVLPDGILTHIADCAELLGNSVCDLRWVYPGGRGPACVVVEAVLRTHPMPQAQAWVTYPVSQPMHASEVLDEIDQSDIEPAAIELDLPGMRLGAVVPGQRHATGAVSVLVEGPRAEVDERVARLMSRPDNRSYVADRPPPWWGRYPFRPGDVALCLTVPEGMLHVVCYTLADAVGAPIPVRGSLGGGPGWAALPGDLPPHRLTAILDALRGVLLARGGSAVVAAGPKELKEVLTPYRQP